MKIFRMKRVIAGFGIFLVFMALCTLISKSVYAYRLPMVSTLTPESKYVEHKVEAEGIVIAGGERSVTYEPGFRIASMPVKVGDRVEEGDVLFQIDLDDLEEMIKEKEAEISQVSLQINAILENQAIAEQKKELELARAREDYDTTARIQDTQVGRAMESYVQAENELEGEEISQEEKELKSALQSAAYGEADAKAARDEAVKQAGRKVEDILLPENVSPDLDSGRLQLSALSEDKKSLQQIRESGGIVTAPFGGVITDILVGTGGRTPDTAVMLLSDESLPCQLKVTLDKDQKKYVGLGDQISVRLEGQSKEFEEKVAYLAESRDAAEKYEVLVELPEKMGMPGASGSISRSDPGEKYRLCLPPAAVHEADKQNFVYVLKSREGILGEEYYVDTVNVKVLDQNDNWVAIEEGILDKESRIILSSTKEIAKGETVRWEE